jgi:hypothetical protein
MISTAEAAEAAGAIRVTVNADEWTTPTDDRWTVNGDKAENRQREASYPGATLRLAEDCSFRKLVPDVGCCGPVYYCIGGYRDNQPAEPLSLCAACVTEHGPTAIKRIACFPEPGDMPGPSNII